MLYSTHILEDDYMVILAVKNLNMWFYLKKGVAKAVNGVSFSVEKGTILGLVGESGSGKSMTALSIMGLVPLSGKIVSGSIQFDGVEMTTLRERDYVACRGKDISMIFQNPMSTLNPVYTIRKQMAEAVLAHRKLSAKAIEHLSIEMLDLVGIPSPQDRLDAFPHQLSGGMNQRIVIAIALINRPKLVLADEPTTALDVTIQSQIIFETKQLVEKLGLTLIWISHDLATISGLTDNICVMYAGRIVEQGKTEDIINNPQHPYTQGLLNSDPARNVRREPLRQIKGQAPALLNIPEGCAFYDRCPLASEECKTLSEEHYKSISSSHSAMCLKV